MNWPLLVVVLFDPDDGLPIDNWLFTFRLLKFVVILLLEWLLVSVLLLLLLLIAKLELLRLLLLLLVSKFAVTGDMPRWLC